jgi:TonB-linked SusC/RagA family outer membrane protein
MLFLLQQVKENARYWLFLMLLVMRFSTMAQTSEEKWIVTQKGEIGLAEVFRSIKQQTGLTVFYSNGLLNDQEKVSLNGEKVKLDDLLTTILKEKNISWTYRKQVIVLQKKSASHSGNDISDANSPATALIEVTGKVANETGAAVPGASVLEKGTRKGVSAGDDGQFVLKVKPGTVLMVSATGFQKKEVAVTGNSVSIELIPEVQALADVVVTTGVGGAASKRKVAISVQTVGADKLPAVPNASIDQALVGKIAGASINSTSGNPGAPVSIQLRGPNTVQNGSQPMVLIDGVEMGASALNTMDLSTVDHIEVVQGAAAATIYGAQGANGVINVFTKKGKSGATHIEFSSRMSWDSYLNTGNLHQPTTHSFQTDANGDIVMLNSAGQPVPLAKDQYGLWGNPIYLSGTNDQFNKPYKDNTQYYDHFKQLFRTAQTINNSLTVSGGKEKSDYALTVSRTSQESVVDGKFTRTNFTSNMGFELFKNFRIRSINQLAYTNNTTGNTQISAALYTYPFADLDMLDVEGNPTYKYGGAGVNSTNPFYFQKYQHFELQKLDIIPSINLNYKLPRFVEFDYKYSINISRGDSTRTAENQTLNKTSLLNKSTWYAGQEGITGGIYNQISRMTTQNSLFTTSIKLDLDKDFHTKLPIVSTTTAAYDWRKRTFNLTANQYTGLPLYAANANQASTKSVVGVYQDLFTTFGYFINERLEWGEIAGISGGFRSDYSSTFGDSKKPQTFPRGDAYFRPSALNFWKWSEWWPESKVRFAYGEAGIQPGVFDRMLSLNNVNFDNGPGIYNPTRIANPALTVERSSETEIGMDLTFRPAKGNWFSLINFSGTWWQRKSKDVIWILPVPISSGATEIKNNALAMSSKGTEFSLDMNMYKSKLFTWNFLTTFGQYTTHIDDIYGIATQLPLKWPNAANFSLIEGQPIGALYGYKILRSIDQTDPSGNPYIAKTLQGNYEIVNGFVTDKSTKRVVFTSDKQYIGTTAPKFNISFTNTFTYKDYLACSFQLDWVSGQHNYNQTKEWMYSDGLHSDFANPVTINGQTGAWAAFYRSIYDGGETNGTKDYFLENASYLRLRNVSLSFNLAKVIKIPFTNKLQLMVSGRNLWTKTSYTGMDPEANLNTTGGGPVSGSQTTVLKGLDYFAFPNTKSVQVGLSIGIN